MMSRKAQNWLTAGLAVYLVSSLVAMAPMSLGAAFCAAAILLSLGPAGLMRRLGDGGRARGPRRFFLISLWLAAACIASVLAARFAPLAYGGRSMPVAIARDIAKLWYLLWPLLLVPAFR